MRIIVRIHNTALTGSASVPRPAAAMQLQRGQRRRLGRQVAFASTTISIPTSVAAIREFDVQSVGEGFDGPA